MPRKISGEKTIWIHAVSVGEVLSLRNLVKEIKRIHPDWIIYFSSLTKSGFQMAREKLREVDSVFFIPFDFKVVIRKFFKKLKPDLLVLAESEFWPNLLRVAKKHAARLLLINGRISGRSYQRFLFAKLLVKRIFTNIDSFLVQTQDDRKKLIDLGVPPQLIIIAGNLKAEVKLPEISPGKVAALKGRLHISMANRIVIAGSTRKGEEEHLLSAYRRAKEKIPSLFLILAPRHPERAEAIEKMCREFLLIPQRYTRLKPRERWDVLIIDTIGELAQFYALSDLAFVGGSLIPWGGQNLLEPAFYKKPVFFGPHMHNFAYIADVFVRSGAATIVKNETDLLKMFLLNEDRLLKKMGEKAKATLNALQGATKITITHMEEMMTQKGGKT